MIGDGAADDAAAHDHNVEDWFKRNRRSLVMYNLHVAQAALRRRTPQLRGIKPQYSDSLAWSNEW